MSMQMYTTGIPNYNANVNYQVPFYNVQVIPQANQPAQPLMFMQAQPQAIQRVPVVAQQVQQLVPQQYTHQQYVIMSPPGSQLLPAGAPAPSQGAALGALSQPVANRTQNQAPAALPADSTFPSFPTELHGMPALVEENDSLQPHSSNAALRVSSRTKRSPLAGAIAKRLRSKMHVSIEAMGAEAVATTATALALAKTFISIAGLSMLVQIESISAPPREPSPHETDHPGLRYVVKAWKDKSGQAIPDHKTFPVSCKVIPDMQVSKVAGQIARMMRGAGENGTVCGLKPSCSPVSLNVTSKAIALARNMLLVEQKDFACSLTFENETQRGSDTETDFPILIALHRVNIAQTVPPNEP
eukprot:TRINITY_DN7971_c0_g1_i1.p1 TRINITY_DN7971_c0_g1~~TRINITY_DN7971_c0_g1_i1.p1  ORF type:complete len:357 (+),score=19.97 TRINITY_DN7971_c0_g1_i1:65-1135(+)